jgi:uncharacterized membrane protein YuzA (DUF378 family)
MCKGNGMCGGCCCGVMKTVKWLLVIGGLNWGIVGVGMLMNNDWNVVDMLLGAWPMVEAIVYVLVGVGAAMKLFGCRCKKCMGACMPNNSGMPNMPEKSM